MGSPNSEGTTYWSLRAPVSYRLGLQMPVNLGSLKDLSLLGGYVFSDVSEERTTFFLQRRGVLGKRQTQETCLVVRIYKRGNLA